jgi:hypothetical protein
MPSGSESSSPILLILLKQATIIPGTFGHEIAHVSVLVGAGQGQPDWLDRFALQIAEQSLKHIGEVRDEFNSRQVRHIPFEVVSEQARHSFRTDLGNAEIMDNPGIKHGNTFEHRQELLSFVAYATHVEMKGFSEASVQDFGVDVLKASVKDEHVAQPAESLGLPEANANGGDVASPGESLVIDEVSTIYGSTSYYSFQSSLTV